MRLKLESFYFFLILCLTYPGKFFEVKLLILFYVLVLCKNRKIFLDFHILLITCVFLIFSFIGLINGSSYFGFFSNIKLYVVYPLLASILLGRFRSQIRINHLISSLLLSMFLITVLGYLLIFNIYFGFLPNFILQQIVEVSDFSSGIFKLNYVGFNSLIFLFPIALRELMVRRQDQRFVRLGLYLLVLSSMLLIFLSGRRAFIVVMCLIFSYNLFIMFRQKAKTFQKILAITFLFVLISLIVNNIDYMLDLFKIEAFQNSEEIRSEQALFLLDNSSLFGSGLAVVPNGSLPYLRSDMTPWVFELTYLQLIYNLGWLFFGFVALLLAHFYYKNIKKGDHFLSLSFLQGAFSILVVAWTNPYISNFETIILLFLVLILPPPSPKFYQGVKL